MLRIPVDKMNFPQFEDEDIINSWKWFMSFISEKEWQKRKANIEKKITMEFRATPPFSEPLTKGTLLVIKDDIIGWYLYLVDMLINEPHKYEFFQGARVIPIFKRFGINLDILRNIEGIEKRVKDLLKKRQSEADALLFEILTALLWAKNGYDVAFIEESNEMKTPDIIAKRAGRKLNIECKRQSKTADYTYRETAKRQRMVSYISKMLAEGNMLLEIVFHEELETLPDTFLRDLLKDKLPLAIPGKIVSNNQVDIEMEYIDIPAINNHLDRFHVKNNSPMLNKLIGKKPVDNKGFTCGINAEFFRVGNGEVNNLYILEIANAFGVYWSCDAKEAIWAKARDIKNQLHKAMQQFNLEGTAIIHIGMETYDGPEVERARFDKIIQTIEKIVPVETNLRWIFCHFFQSYSPPDQAWVFDETVSIISAYSRPISPLNITSLIVPEVCDRVNDVSHWERPLP